MLTDDLRNLWTEPRPPDVPVRVWRDWALLAAGLGTAVTEAALRDDLVWRPVALALAVWLCALLMWRRTRPLAAVALGFGAIILLGLASLVADPSEPVGLDSSVIVLLLVYALLRWGSGREIVLGIGIVLAAFVVQAVENDITPPAEQIAGFGALFMPAVIGASVRFQATAHERLLDGMRSKERERLARELHDTVAHHVSAIVVRAQAGRVLAGVDPAAAAEALEGVEEEGARTLEEMRAMVAALRDRGTGAELAPIAGVTDLERLLSGTGGRLPIDLRLDGDLDALPPAVDAAVYRIVQESVTNARRHSVNASGIIVRVTGEPERITVTVRNDGVRAGKSRDGYGLTGLRERAAMLGGELRAGPGAEHGWQVEAELPRGRTHSAAHSRRHR